LDEATGAFAFNSIAIGTLNFEKLFILQIFVGIISIEKYHFQKGQKNFVVGVVVVVVYIQTVLGAKRACSYFVSNHTLHSNLKVQTVLETTKTSYKL